MSEIAETTVEQSSIQTTDQKIDAAIQAAMSGPGLRGQIPVQEVKIFPQHVEVEVKGIKKAISLMDFKTLIDTQLQVESKLVQFALPYHTYLFAKSASEIQISCYYPERKMNLKYMSQEHKGCQMPNVLINHVLKHDNGNWRVDKTNYFATNKKVTELPEDKLVTSQNAAQGIWLMPFPNFYDYGGMCYGGNTMPILYSNNLRGLDYFYQIIEISPFNNDLGLHGVPKFRDNIAGWFKHLQTLNTFDYSLLRGRGL